MMILQLEPASQDTDHPQTATHSEIVTMVLVPTMDEFVGVRKLSQQPMLNEAGEESSQDSS